MSFQPPLPDRGPGLGGTIVVLACLIATAALIAALSWGPAYGHSLAFNLQSISGFSEQFSQGVLYPRWLNHVDGGGNATFFFYAPLPFWLGSLVGLTVCTGCVPEHQITVTMAVMFLASGGAAYAMLRQHAPWKISLLGAVLYMVLPYHLGFDAWQRAAFGEVAAYVWTPLIFWAIDQIARRPFAAPVLSLAYAGLIFSHLPSALLCSVIMAGHGLVVWRQDGRAATLLRLILSVGGGLGLAAVYLLPALLLQDTINADVWWAEYFQAHLWLIGGSAPPDLKTMTIISGAAALALICALLALLALPGLQSQSLALRWAGTIAVCLLLMSEAARMLWLHAPLLPKVQFPWRLMVIVDLALIQMLVLALTAPSPRLIHRLCAAMTLVLMVLGSVAGFLASPVRDTEWQTREYDLHISGWAQNRGVSEYLPRGVSGDGLTMETLRTSEGRTAWLANGRTAETRYNGDILTVSVTVEATTFLTLPRFAYPGWAVYRNQDLVEPHTDPESGLLVVPLTAGNNVITVKRRPLPPEVTGGIASGLSLVGILGWLAFLVVRTRNQRMGAPNPH